MSRQVVRDQPPLGNDNGHQVLAEFTVGDGEYGPGSLTAG